VSYDSLYILPHHSLMQVVGFRVSSFTDTGL
jgi:hypothetical protein